MRNITFIKWILLAEVSLYLQYINRNGLDSTYLINVIHFRLRGDCLLKTLTLPRSFRLQTILSHTILILLNQLSTILLFLIFRIKHSKAFIALSSFVPTNIKWLLSNSVRFLTQTKFANSIPFHYIQEPA